jgi:hypothetical protein
MRDSTNLDPFAYNDESTLKVSKGTTGR